MQIVSTRDFRSKQTTFLSRAKNGEDILLTSRVGTFRIVPVTEEDAMAERASRWVKQGELIKEGKLETRSVEDFLNEL